MMEDLPFEREINKKFVLLWRCLCMSYVDLVDAESRECDCPGKLKDSEDTLAVGIPGPGVRY